MRNLQPAIILIIALTMSAFLFYELSPDNARWVNVIKLNSLDKRPTLPTISQHSPRLIAEEGHAYRYHFQYEASGSLDLVAALGRDGTGQPRQTSTTKAAGVLEFACVEKGQHLTFSSHLAFDSLSIQTNGQELPAASARAIRDLAMPFNLSVDAKGRLIKVTIPAETSATSSNLLREILNAIQVDLPEDDDLPERWSVKSADSNGEITAVYHLNSVSGSILKIEKTKIALASLSPAASPLSLGGTEQIELDAKTGWLRHLTSNFVYDAKRGSTTIGHSEVSADFVWLGESITLPKWAVEKIVNGARSKVLPMTVGEIDAAMMDQLHRQALGDATFDLLKADLDKADAEQTAGHEVDSHARSRRINQLYAWLELHPEDAHLYSERLAETPQNSESFTLLLGSLYQSGHAEAQLALVQALDTLSGNKPKTVNILAVSGLVAQPDRALEDSVRRAFSSSHDPVVSNTAALALGNMAANLGNDAPRHKALVRDLSSYLENASDLNSQSALIASLGSTMDPTVIPTLTLLTHAESVDIRGAAAAALARIPLGDAIDEIIRLVSNDPDESVRYAAVEGLYNSHLIRPASNMSLAAALDKEDSVRVRASLVRALWTNRSIGGKADQRVRTAAFNDDSAEVRKVARSLIIGHDAPTVTDIP